MTGGIERELKLILEQEEYERLCQHLDEYAECESRQLNTYWDTPERVLTEARVLLRLRIEDPDAWLTSKGRAVVAADGVFESSEDEARVALEVARGIMEGNGTLFDLENPVLERLVKAHGPMKELQCWGRMENLRRRFLLGDLELEIDRTQFPGGVVEWEIEVETDDPRRVAGRVHRLLGEVGIPIRPQSRTKSDRLRERLR